MSELAVVVNLIRDATESEFESESESEFELESESEFDFESESESDLLLSLLWILLELSELVDSDSDEFSDLDPPPVVLADFKLYFWLNDMVSLFDVFEFSDSSDNLFSFSTIYSLIDNNCPYISSLIFDNFWTLCPIL